MSKITRRRFIQSGLAAGGAGLLGSAPAMASNTSRCVVENEWLGTGVLAVISANADRMPHLEVGYRGSMLTIVSIKNGKKKNERYLGTEVTNAHDLVPFIGNDGKYRGFLVVGKGCREKAHLLGPDYEDHGYITVPGMTFRGHGIVYHGDVLVTAEDSEDPMAGGVLLRIGLDGVVKSRHAIGGLRPHHIIDAGDVFAVSNYGNRPIHRSGNGAVRGMSADASPSSDRLFFEIVEPSVSILDKTTLEVIRTIASPTMEGALTHLAIGLNGALYAVLNQGLVFWDKQEASIFFSRHKVSVPLHEKQELTYNYRLPLAELSLQGDARLIDVGDENRDAQSIAVNPASGTTVITFPASHSLRIIDASGSFQDLDSRAFGIQQPRGCAKIDGGHELFIVTGNDNSLAVIDASTFEAVALMPASFSDHSHCRWL